MRRFAIAAAAAMAALVGAWNWSAAGEPPKISAPVSPEAAAKQGLEVATFAAGCFWCVEADFDKVAGVVSTMPGYTGGRTKSPTYWSVATEATGHVEAVQLTFDPKKTLTRISCNITGTASIRSTAAVSFATAAALIVPPYSLMDRSSRRPPRRAKRRSSSRSGCRAQSRSRSCRRPSLRRLRWSTANTTRRTPTNIGSTGSAAVATRA